MHDQAKDCKLIVAQMGARMHYAVPEIFYGQEILFLLFTDLYYKQNMFTLALNHALNWFNLKKVLTRRSKVLPDGYVVSFPMIGLKYLYALSRCKTFGCIYASYLWAGGKFNHRILTFLASRDQFFTGIYSLNTASLELFTHYKGKKLLLLEQCIVPYAIENELLDRERHKYPGWEVPIDRMHTSKEYSQREEMELALADVILSPSEFVRDGILKINQHWKDKIRVVPYGVRMSSLYHKTFSESGPIRILTVGKLGLRKGTPYIMKAAEALKGVAIFRIVGDHSEVSKEVLMEIKRHVEITGKVNRDEVTKHYEWADIFLLPSICEGSATVTYEAMQFGLPMILTRNSGSIIRDGVEGFIISTSSTSDIVYRIKQLHDDRSLLRKFSDHTFQLRHEATYESYANRVMQVVREFIK